MHHIAGAPGPERGAERNDICEKPPRDRATADICEGEGAPTPSRTS